MYYCIISNIRINQNRFAVNQTIDPFTISEAQICNSQTSNFANITNTYFDYMFAKIHTVMRILQTYLLSLQD